MSEIRKLLLGGAVCCLIASLIIPLPSGNGIDANSEVSAGVGPKFRKPWMKRPSSKKNKVKSYPIPKESRQPTSQPKSEPKPDSAPQTPEVTGDVPPSSVMLELQEIYKKNGQQSPNMARHQPRQKKQQQPQRRTKKKNIFSRAYDKITGKSKSRTAPRQMPAYQPDGLPNWNQPLPQPSEEIASSKEEPVELTKPADIIIPPQPQPNFLPGLDVTDVEIIKPAITEGVVSFDENDPFPLPPLPSEVGVPSASQENTVKVADVQETPALDETPFDVALPLPGIDSEETVSSEPETANLAIEQPQQMIEQEFNEPVVTTVEQEMQEGHFSGFANDNNLDFKPSKSDEKHHLPPAPSAVGTIPSPAKSPIVNKVPATYQGWRSRDGQPLPLEPNTLNVPVEARPATLSQAAIVHKEETSDKYRRIAERGSRAGFKGFCPVVLRDNLELTDASPAYRIEYEGAIYYLSTAHALEQFQTTPIRYAPAWGGIDLVKYNTEGVEEAGRLDYAVWYHDRLHLFSSQQSMEQFKSAPESFILEN